MLITLMLHIHKCILPVVLFQQSLLEGRKARISQGTLVVCNVGFAAVRLSTQLLCKF
jgi:hypothetical protein